MLIRPRIQIMQVDESQKYDNEAARNNGDDLQQGNNQKDDSNDPDEATYCLCGQVSHGRMIACGNDFGPIEWFHFNCEQFSSKPEGK